MRAKFSRHGLLAARAHITGLGYSFARANGKLAYIIKHARIVRIRVQTS